VTRLVFSLWIVLLLPGSALATVTVQGGGSSSFSLAGSDVVTRTFLPELIPAHFNASTAGPTSSVQGSFDLTQSGIDIGVSFAVDATGGTTLGQGSVVTFSLDSTTAYAISGSFLLDGSSRNVGLFAELRHFGPGSETLPPIYSEEHASFDTPNEAFVLGQQGGDFVSLIRGTGERSGTLDPGLYRVFLSSAVNNLGPMSIPTPAGGPATADAWLSLALPEPGTGLLVAIALALGCADRRSRRRVGS
jgi:hypothetical protein